MGTYEVTSRRNAVSNWSCQVVDWDSDGRDKILVLGEDVRVLKFAGWAAR